MNISMGFQWDLMEWNGIIIHLIYIYMSGWWCNNHLEIMKVDGKDYPIYYAKSQ
jgi:isocitrate lyase